MRIKDENKADNILKASLQLILSEGIAGLTMSKIAKKTGIATGTLYIYFKNKEVLINELYVKLRKKSIDRFVKGFDDTLPLKIGIKKIWINYLTHRIENYEESVFLEQYYRSAYITKEQIEMAENMKKPVHELIERGKKELLIKPKIDNEMLFLSMLGFIRELADEHVSGIYILTPERIEQAFQLSWDTIKA